MNSRSERGNKDEDVFISKLVLFRNPHIHSALIVQITMIIAAFLILVGVLYVIVLLVLLAVHHYWYDSDPRMIPAYVKHSIQFSSDDEDTRHVGEIDSPRRFSAHRIRRASYVPTPRASVISESSSENSDEDNWKKVGPSSSKKGDILDKFLNDTTANAHRHE